ncbi:peroxisomal membrane anchor protein conserved region-domain-containing protein [Xylariomycetidae sp. FL0641]|nr:peroxisomal membrane anchor protein conserved region-domain-containing protein [Xylariomycetidae sp. FL0641]
MAIREDVVSSAVTFLQDPTVVSSPLETKLSFLRSKNLTQEEIDAAFARTGSPAPVQAAPVPSQAVAGPVQQQSYYGQYQPPPYGWQAPPPEPPKRDWRDWFIMATVMGGVGYGLYFVTKRYISPLVSPPTPEKLEQDKMTVDEQFDKTFATLEQLAKDTEALKASEQERTEKLDKVLGELETFMTDAKSASRRQDDETERLRDDMKGLKAALPKSMQAHKDFTDGRLQEIANEVKSLKSLIGQRMNSASSTSSPATNGGNGPKPATNGNAAAGPSSFAAAAAAAAPAQPTVEDAKENENETETENGKAVSESQTQTQTQTPQEDTTARTQTPTKSDYISSLGGASGRASPFAGGIGAGKASIPAWQLAASKGPSSSSSAAGQNAAGSSS